MNCRFEPMAQEHGPGVMRIFNHYITHSFAAYPETPLPEQAYAVLLGKATGYPAFVTVDDTGTVVGFSFLHAHNPMPVFRETAEVTSFFAPEVTGRGLGGRVMELLVEEGRRMGITRILAGISSLNEGSMRFHGRNGFTECGRFHGIGVKNGTRFDVVWMERIIA